MSPTVRLRREQSGQAMAEYALAMAMVAGARWIERLTEIVAAQPVATAAVIGAVAVTLFVALRR